MSVEAAMAALNERMTAILGESDEETTMTVDDPSSVARRILSGYVPTEEMDTALDVLDQAAVAMRAAWLATPNAASRRASVFAMAAQMMLLGVVIGQKSEEDAYWGGKVDE